MAAVAAFTIGGGVAALTKGDGTSSAGNRQACKVAAAEAYARGVEEQLTKGTVEPDEWTPAVCAGLSEETLSEIAGEVIEEYEASPEVEEAFEDAWREAAESLWPSPSP
ncbi:hypothetical protein K4749_01250 [Streptomyces sp. TRM72054]|uniref:hypothetical protein n=1 Tax=Streptomyces sp. TRM72054 TaxID=2870562 RepID=UPI001C8CF0D7|nr:hypothetical protein [Streptomyces sp. TRM72054]MBX9392257.1 hypothetical protein [Streptomyces sp. TRM72054]